jgi:uncharacterized protein
MTTTPGTSRPEHELPAPKLEAETDRRLLEFLVCPITKSPLHYDSIAQELISKRAQLAFPIRNGVPLMTIDSARHLDEPI